MMIPSGVRGAPAVRGIGTVGGDCGTYRREYRDDESLRSGTGYDAGGSGTTYEPLSSSLCEGIAGSGDRC